jgi:hypothetical protein
VIGEQLSAESPRHCELHGQKPPPEAFYRPGRRRKTYFEDIAAVIPWSRAQQGCRRSTRPRPVREVLASVGQFRCDRAADDGAARQRGSDLEGPSSAHGASRIPFKPMKDGNCAPACGQTGAGPSHHAREWRQRHRFCGCRVLDTHEWGEWRHLDGCHVLAVV